MRRLTGNKSSISSLDRSLCDPNLILTGSAEDVRLFDLRMLDEGTATTPTGCVARIWSTRFHREKSIDNVSFRPRDARRAYVTNGKNLFEFDWRGKGEKIPLFVKDEEARIASAGNFDLAHDESEYMTMHIDKTGGMVLLGSDSGDLTLGKLEEREMMTSLRRRTDAHANVVSCVKWKSLEIGGNTTERLMAMTGGFDNRLVLWGLDDTTNDLVRWDQHEAVAESNINPPHVFAFDSIEGRDEVIVGLGSGDVHIIDLVDTGEEEESGSLPRRRRFKFRSTFEGLHLSPIVHVSAHHSTSPDDSSAVYVTCGADRQFFALFASSEANDAGGNNVEAELLLKHPRTPNVFLAFDDWLIVGDVEKDVGVYRGVFY